jgi:hypothetical protein
MPVSFDDNDDVLIKGPSGDVAEVVTVAGVKRLAVDVNFSEGAIIPVIPANNLVYRTTDLLNSGSPNMAVNGSSTPVSFKLQASGSQTFYLERIVLLLLDDGNIDFSKFGAGAALTNGIQLNMSVASTVYEVCVINNNADIVLKFTGGAGTQGNGGFSPNDAYWGAMTFGKNITLNGGTSDFVEIKIRDNLTGVDVLRAAVHYWEVIS